MLGTDGPDNLRGTDKRDVILALDGDDRIDGRGGNDVICGGAGRDLIKGGQGQDKIFGGADGRSDKRSDDGVRLLVGDVVQGGPGDDLIDLGYDERQQTFGSAKRDRLSYKGSAFRVIVTLGSPKGRGHAQGDGRDLIKSHPFLALLGSDRADTLTGSTYGDEILGRGGADHIDGGGGRDFLVDGPIGSRVGDDVLVGGIGRDSISSYGGRDDLDGGSSADLLTVVHASPGKTTLCGGPGADVLTVGRPGGRVVRARRGWRRERTSWCRPCPARCASGKVDVDLRAGAFGVRGNGGDGCGSVGSIETLTLDNPFGDAQRLRWFVLGTGRRRDRGRCATAAACWRRWARVATRSSGARGTTTSRAALARTSSSAAAARTSPIGGPGTDTCRKVEFKRGCEIPA